ncbi:MAG: RidA family protein [Methyloligellaceae bacterium]
MAGTIQKALLELGIELPSPAKAIANYVPYVISENHLYISGQLPLEQGKLAYEGALGAGVRLEEGQRAARLCAINVLAQANAALGDLDRIEQLVKMTGFINSTPEFQDHPKVMNGASDFMVEVLGGNGKHSRSAVGCSSLPMEAAVEVEAIFRVAV